MGPVNSYDQFGTSAQCGESPLLSSDENHGRKSCMASNVCVQGRDITFYSPDEAFPSPLFCFMWPKTGDVAFMNTRTVRTLPPEDVQWIEAPGLLVSRLFPFHYGHNTGNNWFGWFSALFRMGFSIDEMKQVTVLLFDKNPEMPTHPPRDRAPEVGADGVYLGRFAKTPQGTQAHGQGAVTPDYSFMFGPELKADGKRRCFRTLALGESGYGMPNFMLASEVTTPQRRLWEHFRRAIVVGIVPDLAEKYATESPYITIDRFAQCPDLSTVRVSFGTRPPMKPGECRRCLRPAYFHKVQAALVSQGLRAENIAMVDNWNMTYAEQIRTAYSTDVMVGVSGTNLLNLMFMRAGSLVVEMFPWLMHAQQQTREYAYALSIKWRTVVDFGPTSRASAYPGEKWRPFQAVRTAEPHVDDVVDSILQGLRCRS